MVHKAFTGGEDEEDEEFAKWIFEEA